jgi:hypothetical protein
MLGGAYGVDRTMPAILNGHMTRGDWNRFCDEVDAYLEPINRNMICLRCFTTILFVLNFFLFYALFTQLESSTAEPDDADMFLQSILWSVAIISLAVGIMACHVNRILFKAFADIKAHCENASEQYVTVSFHLHTPPHNYQSLAIEVSVDINHNNNNQEKTSEAGGVGQYLPPPV